MCHKELLSLRLVVLTVPEVALSFSDTFSSFRVEGEKLEGAQTDNCLQRLIFLKCTQTCKHTHTHTHNQGKLHDKKTSTACRSIFVWEYKLLNTTKNPFQGWFCLFPQKVADLAFTKTYWPTGSSSSGVSNSHRISGFAALYGSCNYATQLGKGPKNAVFDSHVKEPKATELMSPSFTTEVRKLFSQCTEQVLQCTETGQVKGKTSHGTWPIFQHKHESNRVLSGDKQQWQTRWKDDDHQQEWRLETMRLGSLWMAPEWEVLSSSPVAFRGAGQNTEHRDQRNTAWHFTTTTNNEQFCVMTVDDLWKESPTGQELTFLLRKKSFLLSFSFMELVWSYFNWFELLHDAMQQFCPDDLPFS